VKNLIKIISKLTFFVTFLIIGSLNVSNADVTLTHTKTGAGSTGGGMIFNPDGTKFYWTDISADTINQINLTTAYDLSSQTGSTITFDLDPASTICQNAFGLAMNDDGTRMFIPCYNTDTIKEIDLSTAYLVSSGSHDDSNDLDVSTQTGSPSGVTFSSDGKTLFVADQVNDKIWEHPCTAAYDVSSCTADVSSAGNELDISGEEVDVFGVTFNNTGKQMYLVGVNQDAVHSYNLCTAYDVSTAVHNSLDSSSVNDGKPRGLGFNNDGTKVYVGGDNGNKIMTYTLDTAFDLNSNTTFSDRSLCGGGTDPTTFVDVKNAIDANIAQVRTMTNLSMGMVSSRLGFIRGNKNNSNLSANNLTIDFENPNFNSAVKALQASNITNKKSNNGSWSFWTDGSISASRFGLTSKSTSSKSDAYSVGIGADKKLGKNKFYGFSIMDTRVSGKVGASGDAIRSDSEHVAFYGSIPQSENNFIEGYFGLGRIKSRITRVDAGQSFTYNSIRKGTTYFGSINYGTVIEKNNIDIIPSLKVDLSLTELDGYREEGSGALSYEKQDIESGITSLGARFNKTIDNGNSKTKPYASIRIGKDFTDDETTKLAYLEAPATKYTYTGDNKSEHIYIYEFGFVHINENGLIMNFGLERIEGNKEDHTNKINLGVTYDTDNSGYSMNINEKLMAELAFNKTFNMFDLDIEMNHSLEDNKEKYINGVISKSF